MHSADKDMFFHNGEVYNYKNIRFELEEKGYYFKSNTDSEVVLYSLVQWEKSSSEV